MVDYSFQGSWVSCSTPMENQNIRGDYLWGNPRATPESKCRATEVPDPWRSACGPGSSLLARHRSTPDRLLARALIRTRIRDARGQELLRHGTEASREAVCSPVAAVQCGVDGLMCPASALLPMATMPRSLPDSHPPLSRNCPPQCGWGEHQANDPSPRPRSRSSRPSHARGRGQALAACGLRMVHLFRLPPFPAGKGGWGG